MPAAAPRIRPAASVHVLRPAPAVEEPVVVVEPATIVAESDYGLASLFVALTRCTRRLAIVHTEPLPAAARQATVRA